MSELQKQLARAEAIEQSYKPIAYATRPSYFYPGMSVSVLLAANEITRRLFEIPLDICAVLPAKTQDQNVDIFLWLNKERPKKNTPYQNVEIIGVI